MSTQPERTVADIPDAHLLKRAVELARPKTLRGEVRWHVVGAVFGLGSTYSAQLCRRFGIDPHAYINKNGQIKPDTKEPWK